MTTPSPATSTGLVILAAGGSRRLGQPKQLVSVSGSPLLTRTVDAGLTVASLWPVVVVLGSQAELMRPLIARRPVLVAENPAWAEGMASSLRVGLDTLLTFSRRLDAVIFALCDQPAFSATVLERLLAERTATGASVVAARYGGHLGAPALITRAHFPALAQLVGDEGARQLFARLPPESVVSVDLPELGFDLDTPADLRRLETRD